MSTALQRNAVRLLLLSLVTVGALALTGRPAHAADTYPAVWKNQPLGATYDTWGMATRYCTSWAAWALHDRNRFEMPFHDNARAWGSRAQALGYAVNMTPAVGAVAWWNGNFGGGFGHVAYVESVGSTTVRISEYNYDLRGNYHERDIAKNAVSGYIHFRDMAPPVAQPSTLTAVQPISVGPSNPVSMYRGVFWSYRIKNTSGVPASIKRLIVAVRTPGGGNMDVTCNNGAGVALAPGQEWTCAAYNDNGYGSSGQFQFWADWQDYNDVWHPGQLGRTLVLHVN
jgi:surface antigen